MNTANPFYRLPSNSMVTGPAEAMIAAFFGPKQHDAHCNDRMWHLRALDSKARVDSVRAELALMLAERRA